MKVLGINGSPRKQGNTAAMIHTVFEELESEGIATELYQLGGTVLRGCTGCRTCLERKDEKCVYGDDGMNDVIAYCFLRRRYCSIMGVTEFFCLAIVTFQLYFLTWKFASRSRNP